MLCIGELVSVEKWKPRLKLIYDFHLRELTRELGFYLNKMGV